MNEYIGWLDEDWNTVLDQNQPIVRCRDCKYYDMTGPWCFEPSKVYIDEYGIEVCATVEPDGYCAWAKPKAGVRK